MSFGLNQQVLWRRCRGLVNSPLALVLSISTCVLVRSTLGFVISPCELILVLLIVN